MKRILLLVSATWFATFAVELCGDWLTFYVGVLIAQSDIEIYPAMEAQPERK